MPELVPYTYERERRTYIRGRFKGKFWADEANRQSNNPYEGIFNIHIYEAEVEIEDARREQEGVYENYENEAPFLATIPSPVPCTFTRPDGEAVTYSLEILGHRLSDVTPGISKSMAEGHERFGTLEGKIYGYIVDVVEETVYQEGPISDSRSLIFPVDESDTPSFISVGIPTGKKDVNGVFERIERHDGKGGVYWDNWLRTEKEKDTFSFSGFLSEAFGCLGSLLAFMFGAFALISILWALWIVFGWQGFTALLVVLAVYLISKVFSTLLIWLLRVVVLVFGVLLIAVMAFGLFMAIRDDADSMRTPRSEPVVDESEKREIRKTEPDTETQLTDSLIVHSRVWRASDGKIYRGDLKVLSSRIRASRTHHSQHAVNTVSMGGFHKIYRDFSAHDSPYLDRIVSEFDSIGKANGLSGIQLADMVVSCVQDIPYVLILDDGCSPFNYSDAFIRDYLERGGVCAGYVKYGVFAPLEFMENLQGDCDTRALFLFSVLDRLGFECAILASQVHGHAILGVHLPATGSFKEFADRRYYAWETTATGHRIGELPHRMSDMRHWEIILTNRSNANR
jgi:hypothetical protein